MNPHFAGENDEWNNGRKEENTDKQRYCHFEMNETQRKRRKTQGMKRKNTDEQRIAILLEMNETQRKRRKKINRDRHFTGDEWNTKEKKKTQMNSGHRHFTGDEWNTKVKKKKDKRARGQNKALSCIFWWRRRGEMGSREQNSRSQHFLKEQ